MNTVWASRWSHVHAGLPSARSARSDDVATRTSPRAKAAAPTRLASPNPGSSRTSRPSWRGRTRSRGSGVAPVRPAVQDEHGVQRGREREPDAELATPAEPGARPASEPGERTDGHGGERQHVCGVTHRLPQEHLGVPFRPCPPEQVSDDEARASDEGVPGPPPPARHCGARLCVRRVGFVAARSRRKLCFDGVTDHLAGVAAAARFIGSGTRVGPPRAGGYVSSIGPCRYWRYPPATCWPGRSGGGSIRRRRSRGRTTRGIGSTTLRREHRG
jgi:hypothetical protein